MKLTQLGPYKIDRQLGKGGMGAVYAATNTQTDQRVAIKALSPHLAMAEGFRERFEAEIESLKTLRHDGIVRLYGYGEQDGVLFYSMELVEGISLEDELKAGRRFTWREVSNFAIQLSLALKHAHDHGIVHRDIKPANILLADDEHVKLADFGIARLFGSTQLTTAGGVLGTADYMSPEQAEGRPVTARCDQYSLGGVMFALLAGRPPFLAKNLPQMLQLQRFANPEPVRRYASDTPEQLEHVISQLLSKDPTDRFPNTQVLARHLQAMVLALSRPASDDFALGADPLLDDPRFEHSHTTDVTQDDPNLASSAPSIRLHPPDGTRATAQDAATMASDSVEASRQPGVRPSLATTAPIVAPPERPTRFTTVEEEEARTLAENARSWPLILAQGLALLTLLLGLGALALFFSREPTADELYNAVVKRAEGDLPLSGVEREISSFLERFPKDSRAEQLRHYQERIELEQLERKLRRQARDYGIGGAGLLPAEQLYLKASSLSESSPEQAAQLFQSLIDLYAPPDNTDQQAKVEAIVSLAKDRLSDLQPRLKKRHAQELTAMRERLTVADKLAASEPENAAKMYRAIVNIYGNQDWAKELVAQAQARLESLSDEK